MRKVSELREVLALGTGVNLQRWFTGARYRTPLSRSAGSSGKEGSSQYGYESNLTTRKRTAGFSLCFHFPLSMLDTYF